MTQVKLDVDGQEVSVDKAFYDKQYAAASTAQKAVIDACVAAYRDRIAAEYAAIQAAKLAGA